MRQFISRYRAEVSSNAKFLDNSKPGLKAAVLSPGRMVRITVSDPAYISFYQ